MPVPARHRRRWTRSGFMRSLHSNIRVCARTMRQSVCGCIYGFCRPVFSSAHTHIPTHTPAHPHTHAHTHSLSPSPRRGPRKPSARATVLRLAPYIRFPPPKQYGQTQPSLGPSTFS